MNQSTIDNYTRALADYQDIIRDKKEWWKNYIPEVERIKALLSRTQVTAEATIQREWPVNIPSTNE